MARKILTLSIGEDLENTSVEQLLKEEFHLSKRNLSQWRKGTGKPEGENGGLSDGFF